MRKQVIVGSIVSLVLAGTSFGGYSFKSVTTSTGGRGADARNSAVQALVEGEHARVEFTEGSNPMMKKGDYVLTKDAGKTMLMVSPTDKTYATWDMEAMMGAAGDMMKAMGGMMKMEFSDPKIEKLTDEAGESILGYPTRHYKFRTTFTTTVSIMGRQNVSSTVKEEEIWATTAITDAGMGAWLRKSPPKTGNESIDKLIQAEMGKVQGFPLRHIMVNSSTDASGRTQTHTTTTEVTELKKTSVPDSTFVVPSDYTELKMEVPAQDESQPAGKKPGFSLPPAFMQMMKKRQPATTE